jgi:hypothetical protein
MKIDDTTRCDSTKVASDVVLEELGNILSRHHFKNSKRYPALLRHLVHKKIEGQTDQLKARNPRCRSVWQTSRLRHKCGSHHPRYAGEIRKRIAQFYHERGNESRLQIDLPLGSYVPEFKHLEVSQQPLPKEVQPAPSTEIRAAATASSEKISGESRGAVLSHARVGSFRVLASAPAFWLLAPHRVKRMLWGLRPR